MDFRGRVVLAPLTKGGNLPFRRLCVSFGCETTMSEMAYALQVVRNRPTELALLRRHDSETCFGVQLAAKRADSGVPAALAAVERGAAFVDINCGCPIHDVVRRGMGAVLMQRPQALGRLLEEMVPQVPRRAVPAPSPSTVARASSATARRPTGRPSNASPRTGPFP
jgi:tRNA-dihydrouridine synthase 3